ncbi:amino acid ABC transporter substrate-binding protein, PAAT family [Andreprevotia lacus DSM 23236]|jgi:polar amino acid transport system substrate-binding protein|uniref:Amino acid ABC transporter substrate-binding protein, PAAT family n=1 Tax=Andreprevotia lacus DSM 23236 TaxID=1121001 RepID=A0A1W1XVI0_9NEIS|nr:transporter substrate-binding domain-containing protein [Andreprevotia lacus]SMC27916.1 amino acid ABC transporter substrate-binding protein, PAAT family [Andreprevotia lacus DSM 23236]
MQHAKRLLLALGLILLGMQSARAAQVIEAWSYYPAPPFQTDPATNAGLTADLVSYLNKALAGRYEIRLVLLPRARLNMMLENGGKAMIVFAPSAIFGGPGGGRYLWSSPLLDDRQELLSRTNRPFEFTGPASLFNMHFGAMLGHAYPVIEKELETGQIHADRATSESSLLNMLLASHADVVTIPATAARYFVRAHPVYRQRLHFSRQHLGSYTRHLMFQQGMKKERDDVELVVRRMKTDPAWIATLKKYGLEPAESKAE